MSTPYGEAVTQGLALARRLAVRLNVDLFEQFATFHAWSWRSSRRPVNLAARLGRLVRHYDETFNRPENNEEG
jgi:hypothetical protein